MDFFVLNGRRFPDRTDLGNRTGWRILTTVSPEAGEDGDSSDAKENRNGYFMIRGIR